MTDLMSAVMGDPTTLILVLAVGGAAIGMAALGTIRALARWSRYQTRPLLNLSEQRLYHAIRNTLRQRHGLSLMCQVCYGEFLGAGSSTAFRAINAKRADLVIVDAKFMPVLVIEYQGAGHYGKTPASQRNARKRDALKRAACKSAGLGFMEVPASFDAEQITAMISSYLDQTAPQSSGTGGSTQNTSRSQKKSGNHAARASR